MLSTKLARRARPPLGVCQPQGLVLPLTSVVEMMTSLSGWSAADRDPAAVRSSQPRMAITALARTRDASDFMSGSLRVRGARDARAAREIDRGKTRRPISLGTSPSARQDNPPQSRGPGDALPGAIGESPAQSGAATLVPVVPLTYRSNHSITRAQ